MAELIKALRNAPFLPHVIKIYTIVYTVRNIIMYTSFYTVLFTVQNTLFDIRTTNYLKNIRSAGLFLFVMVILDN